MKRLILLVVLLAANSVFGVVPQEPIFSELPSGLVLVKSTVIPHEKTTAIGTQLGGTIERLTNSTLRVFGRAIQVNVITATNDRGADAIYATMQKFKSEPFCWHKDLTIIEFTGNGVSEALVMTASYELGLLEKPNSIKYRVNVKLAPVNSLDYMACNSMFNLLASLDNQADSAQLVEVDALRSKFLIGDTLFLRNPSCSGKKTKYSFQPPPTNTQENGPVVSYSFGRLPNKAGVPYIETELEIQVGSHGLCEATEVPTALYVAATLAWPSDSSQVVNLAQQIVVGAVTNDEKVRAILEWLTPGKNIRYSGRTGSRWGTEKVFEQGYGRCWDFSDCFVTLSRAVGIPCRQVAGWLYGGGGHVWAEYFREGLGWQQVDPTGGGQLLCGLFHIPYFVSSDGEMPLLYVDWPIVEMVEAN